MNKKRLRQDLLHWYQKAHRPLPWRATNDPYRIWLSEIILQQTRVEQGLPYYQEFIARFPRVEMLAEAAEDEVLKLWEGLGYYSRARNLHRTAREVSKAGGVFPQTYQGLLALPGIGSYTAAAIASFAFKEAVAVVDGNVFRVLSRLYDEASPIDQSAGKKRFQQLAQDLLYPAQADLHNQAIMELGALTCTPRQPDCPNCPWQGQCLASARATITSRPVKEKKVQKTDRYLHYFLLSAQGKVAVHRRPEGIWKGLYQFPLWESDRALSTASLTTHADLIARFGSAPQWQFQERLKPHLLTHQRLHISVYGLRLSQCIDWPESALQWYEPEDLKTLAFPRPLRGFLDQKQLTLPLI